MIINVQLQRRIRVLHITLSHELLTASYPGQFELSELQKEAYPDKLDR